MAVTARRYKEFNLTQLRVFCEFLRQKSFADAARELGMSHSAVWQQVRALEQRFGVSLLQRVGRTWRPTEDGQALVDLISGVLHSVDSLDEAFRQLRGELPRNLRLIATPGAAAGELVGPVTELKRRFPGTRVEIFLGFTLDQTMEELLSGQADMAFLTGSIVGTLRRRSLETITVIERDTAVIVPTRHPLTRKKQLTLEDLAAYPLILPVPAFTWRQRCDETFRRAGLADKMRPSIDVSLLTAIEQFVRRGVGIGLSPYPTGRLTTNGVKRLSAAHLFPPDEVFLVRRRGRPRPQAQLLEDLLRKGQ